MEFIKKLLPVTTTADKLKSFIKVVGLALLIKVVRYLRWRVKINSQIPGPPDNLIMGAATELYKAGLNDFWGFNPRLFQSLHGRYGKIVRFWLPGSGLFVCCADVDDIAEVNRKCPGRPDITEILLPYLGSDNLLFQKGMMVKNLRLRYGSMVNDKATLAAVHDVTLSLFEERAKDWADVKSVDLHAALDTPIYDIMGQVIFGGNWTDGDTGKAIRKEHLYLIHWASRYGMKVLKDPTITNAFCALSDLWTFFASIKKLRSICSSMIDARRKALKDDPKKFENDRTALSMLCRNKTSERDPTPFFSSHLATSTCIGFLNGAYDTTHSTSFWVFFCLAKYQDAQRKAQSEIDKLFVDGNPTIDQLRECAYLEAVVKESMRLRPTVPIGMRVPEEDVEIAGKKIPAGTTVLPYLHYRPGSHAQFGPEVDLFRPERFLGDSAESKRANAAFDRFGAFSRMCVGMTFAQTELRAMIAWVLHAYSFELADPIKYAEPEMIYEAGVFQPKDKFHFIFKKR